MVPETLIDLLRQAHRYHDTGLRFLDRREDETFHSWAELAETASEVAGSLIAVGIRPGQRVALIYPTEVAFVHAFFGILLVGAVPVPLYPPARLGRLEEYHRRTAAMVQASGAELILTSATVRRLLGRTIELADPPLGCLTLSELPRSAPAEAQPTKDDLALVQFSSGTTVDPKPVALSHRAILAQVDSLLKKAGTDKSRIVSAQIWLADMADFAAMNEVWDGWVAPGHAPARATGESRSARR